MPTYGMMCLVLVITALVSFIISICLTHHNKEKSDAVFGIFIGLLLSILVLILVLITTKPIPAIEVYRGNTALQITYQDSTPIDSVVVYKNK